MDVNQETELTLDDAWTDPVEPEKVETESTDAKETKVEEAVTETKESEEKPEQQETAEKEDSPSESEEKSEAWYIYKAMDEKNKRQALEKKLQALEKAPTDDQEATSVFVDEEKAFIERIGPLKEEFSRELLKIKEEAAIEVHGKEKIDAATTWFNEVAATPSGFALLKRFHESGNSVLEVNRMHDEFTQMQDMKDIPTLKEKLRAEIRQELEKELAEKEKPDKSESITPSLAQQTSSSEKAPVKDNGLTLDSIWGDR